MKKEVNMEQKKVVVIDEESFQAKALEVIEDLADKGGPNLSFTAILGFVELQHRLFHPKEELEETEQEQS